MERERRKLAADVVGYSRLMGREKSGTLARLDARRAPVLLFTVRGCRLPSKDPRENVVSLTPKWVAFGSVDAGRRVDRLKVGMSVNSGENNA